ncbi:MAG: AraC family transcriptional regulator [Firmicutes bacterium]|nr:AraC family transcriptional regulator [Bacillota bacterium]
MSVSPGRVPFHYIGRTNPPLRLETYRFRSGEAIPCHSHEFVEFVYVVRGNGIHYCGQNSRRIQRGWVLLIPPTVEHAYLSSADDPLEVVNLLCGERLWLDVVHSVSPFSRKFYRREELFDADYGSSIHCWQIEESLRVIDRELNEELPGYETITKARLCEILVAMARASLTSSIRPMSMEQCLEFIRRHASEPITIDELAAMTAMSRASFTAKFRAITGTSLIHYRNKLRVELAKALLKTTDMSIGEIAEAIGFSDPSAFYKLFRLYTGTSPRNYRILIGRVSDSP